ncbi:hypothetical protein P9112_007904 [Eukaryota sp. TZLM1-RC]
MSSRSLKIERYVPYNEVDSSDEDDDLSLSITKPPTSPIISKSNLDKSASSRTRSPSVSDSKVWTSLKTSLVDRARRMASLDVAEASSFAEREALLLQRLDSSEKVCSTLRNELKVVKRSFETTKSQLAERSVEAETLRDHLEAKTNELKSTRESLTKTEERFNQLYEQHKGCINKEKEFKNKIDELNFDLAGWEKKMREKSDQIVSRDDEILRLQSEVDRLQSKYSHHDVTENELQSKITDLEVEQQSLQTQLDQSNHLSSQLRHQVLSLEAQLQAAEEEVQVQGSKEMKDLRTKRRISRLKDELEASKHDCLRLMKMLSEVPKYKFLIHEIPEDIDFEEPSEVPLRYLTSNLLDNSLSYFPDGSPLQELKWFVPTDAVIVARKWARKCLPNNPPEVMNNLLLALNAVWMSRMDARTNRLEAEIKSLKGENAKCQKRRAESTRVKKTKRDTELNITLNQLEDEIETLTNENSKLKHQLQNSDLPSISTLDCQSNDFFSGAHWMCRLCLTIFEKVFRNLADISVDFKKGELGDTRTFYNKTLDLFDSLLVNTERSLEDIRILCEDIGDRCA